jgi:hypothetical protein
LIRSSKQRDVGEEVLGNGRRGEEVPWGGGAGEATQEKREREREEGEGDGWGSTWDKENKSGPHLRCSLRPAKNAILAFEKNPTKSAILENRSNYILN